MKKKVLIIGYGSIGRKHHIVLKKIKEISKICILTQQKKIKNKIGSFKQAIRFNPDLIIVSSTTNKHLYHLRNKTSIYEMPEKRSLDLDTNVDFEIIKYLIKKNFKKYA